MCESLILTAPGYLEMMIGSVPDDPCNLCPLYRSKSAVFLLTCWHTFVDVNIYVELSGTFL